MIMNAALIIFMICDLKIIPISTPKATRIPILLIVVSIISLSSFFKVLSSLDLYGLQVRLFEADSLLLERMQKNLLSLVLLIFLEALTYILSPLACCSNIGKPSSLSLLLLFSSSSYERKMITPIVVSMKSSTANQTDVLLCPINMNPQVFWVLIRSQRR